MAIKWTNNNTVSNPVWVAYAPTEQAADNEYLRQHHAGVSCDYHQVPATKDGKEEWVIWTKNGTQPFRWHKFPAGEGQPAMWAIYLPTRTAAVQEKKLQRRFDIDCQIASPKKMEEGFFLWINDMQEPV